LTKLEQYQPRSIGLDIYRDFPAEPPDLISRLQKTDNLIGVCKGSDTIENTKGIAPPPEIPKNRLGFSDFIHDSDSVVRRHLMFMTQEAASLCYTPHALNMQVAFRYLLPLGIEPKFTAQKNLQLGNTVFHRLSSRASGYQGIDANGGQILLNYRSTKKIAQQLTLTEFLSNQINKSAIKDKIVLVGVTAKGDFPDYWDTPYGTNLDNQMSGVLIHAHMVSQILSAVLDGRPLLRVWSGWWELLWIWSWSLVGGVLAWRLSSLLRLILAISVTSGVLYLFCFGLLIWGAWVPFVPSTLSLLGTVGVTSIKNLKSKI
jgi:CHASE2 domain-containing sensor protein